MEGTAFIFWNWSVVIYLFVAGVSAGAFALSAFAYLVSPEKYRTIIRIGAYLAPFPLIFGLLCLVYDLEQPHLFWKLMVTVKPASIMSIGSWLLALFSALSFLNFYLWLPDRFDVMNLGSRLFRRRSKSKSSRPVKANGLVGTLRRSNLNRLRGFVAVAGIPVALLVGVYTGMLLSILGARPFWNNPMLPMLFLVSALKTGTAAVCMTTWFIRRSGYGAGEQISASQLIRIADTALMLLSIVAIALFVFGLYTSPQSSSEVTGLIMGGPFTFLFWGMAVLVGVLFPLIHRLYEMLPHSRVHPGGKDAWISGLATLCTLVGGYFLRYVIVYAGQAVTIALT